MGKSAMPLRHIGTPDISYLLGAKERSKVGRQQHLILGDAGRFFVHFRMLVQISIKQAVHARRISMALTSAAGIAAPANLCRPVVCDLSGLVWCHLPEIANLRLSDGRATSAAYSVTKIEGFSSGRRNPNTKA